MKRGPIGGGRMFLSGERGDSVVLAGWHNEGSGLSSAKGRGGTKGSVACRRVVRGTGLSVKVCYGTYPIYSKETYGGRVPKPNTGNINSATVEGCGG